MLAKPRLLLPPSRHSAGQPIVAGWADQWIAQLGFDRDSWTAPVDARRLHPLADTDQTAAQQIRLLLERLPVGGPLPWLVFDGGYDSAQLTLDLADAPAAVLVRLGSDRCCYADPPPQARSPRAAGRAATAPSSTAPTRPPGRPDRHPGLRGRPVRHGHRGHLGGAASKQQRHPSHGSRGPRPIVRGTVICVQVERVPARTRPPKVLGLGWAGPGQPDLDLAWRAYVRRFDLEHTLRFCKQTLGWTTPRPRHPEQADRWTWLGLASHAQLRLARPAASDQRLPWERPDPAAAVTGPGPPWLSPASRPARLASCGAETRRALPGPAQGPLLGSRRAVSGHQQAHQEGNHGHQGRPTGSDQPARPPT